MAGTTTAVNACDAVIQLADENDVLMDISGSTNECNLGFTKNIGGTKVFGSQTPIRRQCGVDFSLDLTALFTTALNEARDVLFEWAFAGGTGSRRFKLMVPNSNIGGFTFTGKVVLQKMDLPLKADDAAPILIKSSMMADGDLDYAVTAS